MRPLAVAAALAVAGWLGLAPAMAETFVLDDGETIAGEIVQATRNTITIRRTGGGMRQLPLARLERVEVTTADGRRLQGRYRGWQAGRSGIEVGTEVLWLEGGRVVERAPLGSAPAGTATARPAPPPSAPAVSRPALADREPAERLLPAVEPAAGPEPAAGTAVTGALPPPPQQAARGPEPAAAPAGDLPVLSVRTAPAEIDEQSGSIVFNLELSRPLEDLLVVIYSTVDQGAAAGSDYQPLQGILSLPPGATSSEIRTGVMDDDEAEGDESFQLFLASNPDLTVIDEPWTKVTIRDDD
jgi:Calx-beta domain